jgi:hypothetical protein
MVAMPAGVDGNEWIQHCGESGSAKAANGTAREREARTVVQTAEPERFPAVRSARLYCKAQLLQRVFG